MSNPPSSPTTADVLSLDATRQGRHYIDLANADPVLHEIKASFAFEGIELSNHDAEEAGRIISRHITYPHEIDKLRAKYI